MPKKDPKPSVTTCVRDGFTLEVDAETSLRLAGIRQKDTKPELVVRRILRHLGIGYRTSNRDLPGSPDIANRRRKWAMFIHGCFWHRHPGCRLTTTPKRNRDFWEAKFERNQARDLQKAAELREQGFTVITIWECETRQPERLAEQLRQLLSSANTLPSKGSDSSTS